jgi:hypothetical protein
MVVTEPVPVAGERLPYLRPDGTLCIPFDSPERYHWWKAGGQDLDVTLAEVRARCGKQKGETDYGDGV